MTSKSRRLASTSAASLRMLFGLLLVLAMSGCIFLDVKRQQAKLNAQCILSGTVAAEHPSDDSLVVVLVRRDSERPDDEKKWKVFDHFVSKGDGRWFFFASPGTYGLAAFQDISSDLVFNPDEPFVGVETAMPVDCAPGDELQGIALTITASGWPRKQHSYDIAALQARTVQDQMLLSLGLITTVGEVAPLDDPRFSAENASKGIWRPFDFLLDARPGIYFLEPYAEDKIPVLFVHGMGGSPRAFAPLVDGLDRTQFQPWIYYYPSGARLEAVAAHLQQTMVKLQHRYKFERFALVAHSMGGLVARSFIFLQYGNPRHAEIPVFITIVTPWNGHAAAGSGVRNAPAVVESWHDMAPESVFLTGLFMSSFNGTAKLRDLPPPVEHHLVFGYQRNPNSFGPSSDRTITLESQLRDEAQEDADRLYGYNETHTGILESLDVSRQVRDILEIADW